MIFDRIQHHETYQGDPRLKKVLSYFASLTPDTLPTQPVQLDGTLVYVNPVNFQSKPESQCLFEGHRRYADVHFVLEGSERAVILDSSEVQVHTPYDEEKDIGFFTGEGGVSVVIHPGEFLVCYPQDVHKVGIAPQEPAPVKKLVGKVWVE